MDKSSEKGKLKAIEEAFYGDASKNIIGACQQLVDGDQAFVNLHNNYKGDDGNERVLKSSCCGQDTTSNYVAGRDLKASMLLTFVNGKPFQGHTIWNMADEVMASLKKALSLVPQHSLKIDMIDPTCRVVGYASGKNEQLFLQAIDKGVYNKDKNDQMGLSLDDDNKLGFSAEDNKLGFSTDDEDDGDVSLDVEEIDVDSLMSNLKNGWCDSPSWLSFSRGAPKIIV